MTYSHTFVNNVASEIFMFKNLINGIHNENMLWDAVLNASLEEKEIMWHRIVFSECHIDCIVHPTLIFVVKIITDIVSIVGPIMKCWQCGLTNILLHEGRLTVL